MDARHLAVSGTRTRAWGGVEVKDALFATTRSGLHSNSQATTNIAPMDHGTGNYEFQNEQSCANSHKCPAQEKGLVEPETSLRTGLLSGKHAACSVPRGKCCSLITHRHLTTVINVNDFFKHRGSAGIV